MNPLRQLAIDNPNDPIAFNLFWASIAHRDNAEQLLEAFYAEIDLNNPPVITRTQEVTH